jgi:hypothetical protein
MKAKITITVLFITLLACRKESPLVLDGALTDCTTCTYNYYENADYNTTFEPVTGSYRVFQYKNGDETSCGPTSSLFFKEPLSENQFVIDSAQIVAGKVSAYYFSCPCCDEFAYFPNTPMGGQIKAKRTTNSTWLINATVIMGYQNKPVDTIIVNQYFSIKSL